MALDRTHSQLLIAHIATHRPIYLRLFLPAILIGLLLTGSLQHIVVGVLSDAFYQVGVFVAGTLAVYHSVIHLGKRYFKRLTGAVKKYDILAAAFLGALPGCGGAIVVITQFIRGQSSFGAMVAVLTATMGDAAFVLLAARPKEGLLIIGLGVVVGTITGYIVNAIHGRAYLKPTQKQIATRIRCKPKNKGSQMLWKWLLLPGIIIGVLIAFQIDVNQLLGLSVGTIEWIGAGCALASVIFWGLTAQGDSYQDIVAEDAKGDGSSWLNDVAYDTNFVLAWVIVAFLLFELVVEFTGIDLKAWFSIMPVLTPLIAIAIGLLPGCGPQIIVTTLYINGFVPFSAQVGNAIANDGDALFPAIALAPKAALVATIYSGIPAIVVAYGFYFFY